jgi:tRNA dimethylallyltransferase
MKHPKVLLIVGPTASGKTSLSIELARTFTGEVISADSRQVYRGLNLGTGKVTPEEMAGVPHHLLDIVDPRSVYTVHDFVRDAEAAITAIMTRQHLPIVAGGTFLYTDALIGRVSLPPVPPDPLLRAELTSYSTTELYERLQALDPTRAAHIDPHNTRRLVRAIEVATALGAVPPPKVIERYDTLTIGISITKEVLHANIARRLCDRLEAGMVAEVEGLIAEGVPHERLEDLGLEYRYLSRYLRGELSYDAMVEELEAKIRQFAKRQMTWLKRDQTIHWHDAANLHAIIEEVDVWLRTT